MIKVTKADINKVIEENAEMFTSYQQSLDEALALLNEGMVGEQELISMYVTVAIGLEMSKTLEAELAKHICVDGEEGEVN